MPRDYRCLQVTESQQQDIWKLYCKTSYIHYYQLSFFQLDCVNYCQTESPKECNKQFAFYQIVQVTLILFLQNSSKLIFSITFVIWHNVNIQTFNFTVTMQKFTNFLFYAPHYPRQEKVQHCMSKSHNTDTVKSHDKYGHHTTKLKG